MDEMAQRFGAHILKASTNTGLNPRLIVAIIYQESSGNPYAFRYEGAFFNRYLKGKRASDLPGHFPPRDVCSFESEIVARSCSWGLMQIMGELAREQGFKGDSLLELCDPGVNIELGTKILAHFLKKSGDDIRAALLRWNGGANKSYPDEVFSHMDNAEADFLFA